MDDLNNKKIRVTFDERMMRVPDREWKWWLVATFFFIYSIAVGNVVVVGFLFIIAAASNPGKSMGALPIIEAILLFLVLAYVVWTMKIVFRVCKR